MKDKQSRRWVYGVNPVLEALKAGRRVSLLYVSAGRKRRVAEVLTEARARDVPVKVVHDPAFFDTRFPKGHQGVAARVQEPTGRPALEDLLAVPSRRGEPPLFVVLDLIEDPRNLGSILRTAEAAGVHGVVTQKRRAASLGPEALKASAGAAEHIALAVVPNIKHALREMKEAGILAVGAEAEGEVTLWEADLAGPLALVVGSEGRGLRKTVREMCDLRVGIPLRGRVGSLNAGVAAGVLLYEVLRQRART
ncbi:MAG: 23S rRNA (guanosine(2251)-2'-O)-methyltransferase RlmB [Nitrospirota bacterium]|jgi:23S rRNA (guanosine2251-2'-O)-methyltransferase